VTKKGEIRNLSSRPGCFFNFEMFDETGPIQVTVLDEKASKYHEEIKEGQVRKLDQYSNHKKHYIF
jgi:hypothetical protein